jgi:hypothetical protein
MDELREIGLIVMKAFQRQAVGALHRNKRAPLVDHEGARGSERRSSRRHRGGEQDGCAARGSMPPSTSDYLHLSLLLFVLEAGSAFR